MLIYILLAVSTAYPDEDHTQLEIDEMMDYRASLNINGAITEISDLELIPEDLVELLESASINVIHGKKDKNIRHYEQECLEIIKPFYKKPKQMRIFELTGQHNRTINLKKKMDSDTKKFKAAKAYLSDLKLGKHVEASIAIGGESDVMTIMTAGQWVRKKEEVAQFRIALGLHTFDEYDYNHFLVEDLITYKNNLIKANTYQVKKRYEDIFK